MSMHRCSSAVVAVLMCAGAALGQTEWINAAGGNWNTAANWSPMDIPNSAVESALLGDLGSPYTVDFDLSTTLLGITLHPSATLEINAAQTLLVTTGGALVNDGVILVNDTGSTSNAAVRAAGAFSILGTGRVELNAVSADLNDASVSGVAGAEVTIGAGQKIHGSGVVQGPVALAGLIESDRPSRDIVVAGTIDLSSGGVMRGVGGGLVALQGTTIGGSLDGGVEVANSAASIDGSTSTGANGVRPSSILGLGSAGLTNNGLWIVNTLASTSNATMRAAVDATIDGDGIIELNAISADLNDAQLGGLATLTLGAGQEVRGSGMVNGPLVLQGAIIADRDSRDIAVSGMVDASGGGVLQAVNNAAVSLQAQLTGGTLAGGIEAQFSATTIDGVHTTGVNGIRPAAVMTLIGDGLTNDGVLTVNTTASTSNARLVAGANTVIDGAGRIDLNSISADLGDAQIDSQSGPVLTIAAQQSITGSGIVTGSFIIDGVVNADRDGRDIAVIGDVDLTGGGTLMGTNNGRVSLRGNVEGGTLAGGVEAELSSCSLNAVTAEGDNGVRPAGVLDLLSGGLTNNGVFTINTTGSTSDARFVAVESTTIDGAGVIDLNSISGDLGDAKLEAAEGVTLTIGSGQSVTGSGVFQGIGTVPGTVVCNGVIRADRPGRDLQVGADVDLSGGGAMQGVNGGIVTLRKAATGGSWLGGVEAEFGNASASGVVMTGTNGVRHASTLRLDASGITNDGTLVVNTTSLASDAIVQVPVSTTIAGSGTILLNGQGGDLGDAQLRTVDQAVLTVGPSQTLAGRGLLNGSIVVEGTLAPGSDADPTLVVAITGQTTLGPDATTMIDIGGASVTSFDRLTGFGTLVLDGTLELALVDGFVPAFEEEFVIVDVGAIQGDFDAVETPTIGLGLFRVIIGPDTVKAVWTCEADLNGDGILDFFDVQTFLNAFAEQALYGDYNEDGVNDFFDVQAFLNDFAAGCL